MVSLSKSEYEVLSLLWAQEKGLTAVEINELSPDKSWKDVSIHLIINSMLDKGAIKVNGMVRSGRTYSRLFEAAVSPEEYSLMQVKENVSFAPNKSAAISSLFSALLDSESISRDDISKIEELVKKKKEEK